MADASAPMIADAPIRERALDPAGSFIVQAPAGSGKTTLLVSRFLKLLEKADRPEEVLAITFTRKAAAEMRKRVLEKLHETPALARWAGEIAHRLRIETIDAFCLSLARQLPVPSQFGVAPGIADDPEPLYREAAWRAASAFGHPAVARLLAHLDNDVGSAVDLLAGMLRRRDQWLRKTGRAPTREELELAFASERSRLLQNARQFDSRSSEAFAREMLTQKNTWRKKSREAQALSGNEPLRLALASLLKLPPEKYSEPQWAALEAMLALLPRAAAELKLVFAARGEADFTEVAQGAVRALGSVDDPSELLLSLDAKIFHILVDEFQDTSISQWELLERLTAGWQPGDGRTLFVVGDPMQSIYRFREAEVGLFLRARREGLPNVKLEPLALKTNFRSQAGIVDWVNASFSKILPLSENEASGAVPYSPAASSHPALPGEAVTWHACADSVLESRRIIELIKEAKNDCALLVRNRSALADIVPALKSAGIRFRAIEIDKLGEKQVVQDLFALTRALTHPADRVAWLAILRAPWVGFALNEFLNVIPAEAGIHTVWESIQSVPRLERFPFHSRARARRSPARHAARPRRRRLALARRPGLRRRPRGPGRRRNLPRRAGEAGAGGRGGLRAPGRAAGGAVRAARSRGRRGRPADHDHPQGQGPGIRHRHRAGPAARAGQRRCAAHALEGADVRQCVIPAQAGIQPAARPDQGNRRRRRAGLRIPEEARPRSRGHRSRAPALRRRDAREASPAPARLPEENHAAEAQPARLRVAGRGTGFRRVLGSGR